MHVFVTGATGWVGSAVVPELLAAGHEVVGLARSDASAAKLAAAGATALRGSLDDLDVLRAGAADADGVIHLAFIHDFERMADSIPVDRAAIETLADTLAGTGKPLLVTSGTAAAGSGRVTSEQDAGDLDGPGRGRIGGERAALAAVERDVRSIVVRLSPTVHGAGDPGFVAILVAAARKAGSADHVGDGANRWAAVHRSDAARLYRLALESAPAGSVLHAVGEEGVPTRAIAEAIGSGLGLPTASIEAAEAQQRLGFVGGFFALDVPSSSASTRALLGWEPSGPTLLEDLAGDSYFAAPVPG
ncbi:SDR family oxidoreductase [Conexibacter sp. JD483]|uniref:SDR family oxidoreductase n=1 Tax=unclassified Conexibacter TaxID=2627773 RepID=UPI00271E1B25|nr:MULTISPECIES: SDR family oxidoreductase [unclassified Conexibacter]MDO8189086.1 SDR family oxidoreductase [Conexibacter sp. CPCC 205706]MDO8201867.1 SDR family oxidoreductase [Conexibacter sp. CPCC 205762]MDR9372520.1 SDR family oxidoreductase [Conexibacter sp. JD483]